MTAPVEEPTTNDHQPSRKGRILDTITALEKAYWEIPDNMGGVRPSTKKAVKTTSKEKTWLKQA